MLTGAESIRVMRPLFQAGEGGSIPTSALSLTLDFVGLPLARRLVSYHDTEVHSGAIYRGAGWVPTTVHDGHGFDKSNRGRPAPQTDAPKQRWEKPL